MSGTFILISAVLVYLGIWFNSDTIDRCAKALERIADVLERKEAGQ